MSPVAECWRVEALKTKEKLKTSFEIVQKNDEWKKVTTVKLLSSVNLHKRLNTITMLNMFFYEFQYKLNDYHHNFIANISLLPLPTSFVTNVNVDFLDGIKNNPLIFTKPQIDWLGCATHKLDSLLPKNNLMLLKEVGSAASLWSDKT